MIMKEDGTKSEEVMIDENVTEIINSLNKKFNRENVLLTSIGTVIGIGVGIGATLLYQHFTKDEEPIVSKKV